ncbi:hypothetical protein [Parapedobacter pyrenivorans]|nr:hypothetical protein [Parapedobacter pyrenivorans]
MKHVSIMLFVGAASLFWSCESTSDLDDFVENEAIYESKLEDLINLAPSEKGEVTTMRSLDTNRLSFSSMKEAHSSFVELISQLHLDAIDTLGLFIPSADLKTKGITSGLNTETMSFSDTETAYYYRHVQNTATAYGSWGMMTVACNYDLNIGITYAYNEYSWGVDNIIQVVSQ